MDTLKSKLKNKTALLGWISIPSPVVAEIVSKAGFDAVVIDMEHSAIDMGVLQTLVQVIEPHCPALVRLSSNDDVIVKRVLDIGAHGIIVPMVNDRKQAEQAVGSAKYPPEGFRSTGIYRAQGYGESFEDYRFSANGKIVVIVQIEHKDAVENIEEIMKVPGIDGVMIGPYDLSSTYGIAGELNHPIMEEAISKVMKAAREHKVSIGTHVVDPSVEKLQNAIDKGFSFIIYSNDSIVLNSHYSSVVRGVRLNK